MNWKKINWWFLASLILFIVLIPVWVYLIANKNIIGLSDKTNEIGDALGGITNPIIGIGGIILTFCAFYVQYQFNREQSARIDDETKERLDDKKSLDAERNFNYLQNEFTRLESKIFEISKIHLNFNVYAKSMSFNVIDFNYDVNRLDYALINFNNIIKLTKLQEIENFNIENGYLNTYDEIILINLENLFSVVLDDCITSVEKSLRFMIDNGLIKENVPINQFFNHKDDLELKIGKVKHILSTAYPNFGTI